MTTYEDEKRVDEIQRAIYAYVNSMGKQMLLDSWTIRRDLVAEKRLDRVKAREQLKEDLIWLIERVEERTRQGAGSGVMMKERAAIKMIVEVL